MFVLMAMLMVGTKMQAQEPYAVLSDDNTVLTFYYDDQKEARGGMSVGPFTKSPSWYNAHFQITTAVFDASFANCTSITSTAYWFLVCIKLTTIVGIENLKTDNVTDMALMFNGCNSLTSLDLSHFNTANVTDMGFMFSNCRSLTSLDVSNFNTAKVTNMYNMFFNCSGLTSLDLSHFNTANVTDMNDMFYGCGSLMNLNLSSFNTANVTTMRSMFHYCESLTSLDVSNFNTANVTTMNQMFFGCSSLPSLDLSSFNTANVTDMGWMFSGCPNLATIYASDLWSTEKVTDSFDMFGYCGSLVGGQGTVYDSEKTDATYARIDGGTAAPGYFTYKAATGVKGLTRNADLQHAPVYNLGGQQLTAPLRGINIIGGKKVVLK